MPEHITAQNPNSYADEQGSTSGLANEQAGSIVGDGDNYDFIREQDRLLPIANVSRIMKQAIPSNAKIAKDAKETVQECVSELISFVTSEACERCQQEKRKTINGDDIIWALESLGFDQYSHLMKIYLQRYKDITKMDKGNPQYDDAMNLAQMGYSEMPEDMSKQQFPSNM